MNTVDTFADALLAFAEGVEFFAARNPDVKYSKTPLGKGWTQESLTKPGASPNRWVRQGGGVVAAGAPAAPSAPPIPHAPSVPGAKPAKVSKSGQPATAAAPGTPAKPATAPAAPPMTPLPGPTPQNQAKAREAVKRGTLTAESINANASKLLARSDGEVRGFAQKLGVDTSGSKWQVVNRVRQRALKNLEAIQKRTGAAKQVIPQTAAPAPSKPPVIQPAPPQPAAPTPGRPPPPKITSAIHGFIDKAANLSSAQKQTYKANISKVIHAMPEAAHKILDKNLRKAYFHATAKDLSVHILSRDLAKLPADSPKRTRLEKLLADAKSGKWEAAGAVQGHRDELVLDGDQSRKEKGGGKYERITAAAHNIYAHELGHVLGKGIDDKKPWADAFNSEIAWKKGDKKAAGLSQYGGQSAEEGFAEFSRLVYASNVPLAAIEKEFPKSAAVFKTHGLWPAHKADVTAPATKMPEAFNNRVDLGKNGHIDVVRKPARKKLFGLFHEDKLAEALLEFGRGA